MSGAARPFGLEELLETVGVISDCKATPLRAGTGPTP
jgi:hypothetical protein